MVLHTTYVLRSTIKLWCCVTTVILILAGNSFWCFVHMVLIVQYSCAVVSVFGLAGNRFWFYILMLVFGIIYILSVQ